MSKNLLFTLSFLLPYLIIGSCTSQVSVKQKSTKHMKTPKPQARNENAEVNCASFDMSNPALMMGTNLGILFKTYYKVGDYSKMLTYTSSSTIRKYGKEQLRIIYRNLDLGYEMKLTNMTTEGNEKILFYEIVINATKLVKRLHVVIENDTARVVPQHLERGEVFE